MNKSIKLRLCDWSLIPATLVILASGIQLEATEGKSVFAVWFHIVVGICFFVLIGWHLYLHYRWSNWAQKLMKQKSPVNRWLAIFCALTLISAVIATVHWLFYQYHTTLGGIHGKIGFIFIALCIGHLLKRIKSPVLKNKKKQN